MGAGKDKLLIVGAGGLGRVVLEHASALYDCAFLDDSRTESVDGTPVIGTTNDMEKLCPKYRLLLVAIGNNSLRESLYKKAVALGYAFPNVVHVSAYVSPHASIGNGCIILNNVVIQNGAKCGNGCILNPGVELHHDSAVGDYCLIYTNSVIRSLTHVGDRAWIGSTVTVSTGSTVPNDDVVPDGTVVSKDS